MKWREITVTILACVLLMAGGAWGVSRLYRAFFHPRAIVEENPTSLTGWQEAQAQYERKILYPFPSWLESGSIAETDGTYLLSDNYHIHQSLYSSVFGMAGLAWEDLEAESAAVYEFQPGTAEYDEYGLRHLFHMAAGEGGHEDLVLAVNESGMPVLFQYGMWDGSGSRDAGAILRTPVAAAGLPAGTGALAAGLQTATEGSAVGLPAGTEEYIAGLDEALGQELPYRRFLNALADGIGHEGELPEIRLADYDRYGQWSLYSDSLTAAYACVINDRNFILYYDTESGSFCGYSIALNPLE